MGRREGWKVSAPVVAGAAAPPCHRGSSAYDYKYNKLLSTSVSLNKFIMKV
jgi:hypothetical protein